MRGARVSILFDAELDAVFEVIERMLVEGDIGVENLAEVGYLEDIQNVVLRTEGLRLADFDPYLRAGSRLLWDYMIEGHDGDRGDAGRRLILGL
jgi:hypothetical protein